jgi:hypothetical protein
MFLCLGVLVAGLLGHGRQQQPSTLLSNHIYLGGYYTAGTWNRSGRGRLLASPEITAELANMCTYVGCGTSSIDDLPYTAAW